MSFLLKGRRVLSACKDEWKKKKRILSWANRTAGSLAERKNGDMLVEEMKKAGLVDVHKGQDYSRCLGI